MNIIKKIGIILVVLLTSYVNAEILSIDNASDLGNGHANFPASNTIDGSLNWSSRWSASGSPVNLKLDLGSVHKVTEVGISWGRGRERVFTFEIWARQLKYGAWTKVYDNVSTGKSASVEVYDIIDISAQQVRIKTFSNSAGSNWTDIKEVEVYGISNIKPVVPLTKRIEIPVAKAFDDNSSHSSFPASKAIDGIINWSSRWAAEGDGDAVNLTLELAKATQIKDVGIAWGQGDSRTHTFEVYGRAGTKGGWTKIYDSVSSGNSISIEIYNVKDLLAKQIRIKGQANSTSSDWTSITEVKIYGGEDTIPPTK